MLTRPSKLALEKSSSDDIKSFAQIIIDDHTKIGENFKTALAASETKEKPTKKQDAKNQKSIDELKAASGDDFDSKFIKIQKNAHVEAVELFSEYSKNGKNGSLKEFATAELPTLKAHLDHVNSIQPTN